MVSLQQFVHEGLIHVVSSWQLTLRCYLNSVKHLFGLQFLKLVTLINFLSCGGPHEIQVHHSAWWFLGLHLKILSKFLKCSALTDRQVSLLTWSVLAIIWIGVLPNRDIFCLPPLPRHNTTERMTRVCKAVIKAKGGYFEEAQI
jgi:hypothetical protein